MSQRKTIRQKGNGQTMQRQEPDSATRDRAAERLQWFFKGRRDAKGNILKNAYAKALRKRWELQREQIAKEGRGMPGVPPGGTGSINWTPIGPSVIAAGAPFSGRITAIVAGPASGRVYAGADNGGVWFSGDGGATWSPLDDYIVSPSGALHIFSDALAVGSLDVRFGAVPSSDEIYVGTGGYEYMGIGIRHSTAGGAPGSWTLEATNLDDSRIPAITIDPDNPVLVLAGTEKGLFKRPLAAPFDQWTQVTSPAFANANGAVSHLIVAGTGANKQYFVSFFGDKVYSSPDGATWTAVAGMAAGSQQVALAAGESDPSAVYAFTNQGILYRLHSGSFQTVAGTPSAANLFPLGQGNFDLVVAVDPANASTVYLVGEFAPGADLALFRGTLSGGPGSWNFGFNPANAGNPGADPTYCGSGIHPDGHVLVFGLKAMGTAHDSTSVWVGCDGGVYRSTLSGANGSFKPNNTGLATAQSTYLANRYDTDAVAFVGLQDNGTVRFLGEQAFIEPIGGDGGGVAVDPNNPYQVMRQYIHASVQASSDGGFNFFGLNFPPVTANTPAQNNAAAAESVQTDFYTVIATTPPGIAPTLVGFGTNRLWLTNDWGATWVTLPTGTNPYTPATPNAAQDVIDGQPVTAIAFASPTQVYAATYKTIWRYDKVGPNWTKTVIDTSTLPSWRYISSIAVDPTSPSSFYATMASHGLAHLYYYNGTGWLAAMPASVVDAPTFAVAIDPSNPNTVYVGTDVGCWHGTRTGPATWTWNLFSQGLPESSIHDLKVHDRARLLRAATHGRGVWEIVLTGVGSANPDLYFRANYGDTGRVNGGSRNPWVEGLPDPTRQGFPIYHYMSPDIKIRRGSLGGLPALNSPPNYYDFAVDIGDYIDSTTDIETADITGPDRYFVEVHNRSVTTPVAGPQVSVLLLLADASAGLPGLPSNYAAHIAALDASPTWLSGSAWRFADSTSPYRTLTGILDVRTPQVVSYDNVDISTVLSLPSGHTHACAAAFVTTPSDPFPANLTETNLDVVAMQDKHIAQRNLHLVTAGATPLPAGNRFAQQQQTVFLDFHNSTRKEVLVDLVFDRRDFPGSLSVILPHAPELSHSGALEGFKLLQHKSDAATKLRSLLGEALEHVGEALKHIGDALERHPDLLSDDDEQGQSPDRRFLRKLASLDHTNIYVAQSDSQPTLKGVRIPGGNFITAAIVLKAPADAFPGKRYAFHVLQRDGAKILGGSAYVFAVTATAKKGLR